jgi:hypothetical protein
MDQDEQGVWTAPSGDRIAWFADPDGHVLSVTATASLSRAKSPNGGYAVAGSTTVDNQRNVAVLLRVDRAGTVLWQRVLTSDGDDVWGKRPPGW